MDPVVVPVPDAAPRDVAFNFLADIEHLPAWSGGFCEWIELRRDGWRAYTAWGEFEAGATVAASGAIHLRLRRDDGLALEIILRVTTGRRVSAEVRAAGLGLTGENGDLRAMLAAGLRAFADRGCCERGQGRNGSGRRTGGHSTGSTVTPMCGAGGCAPVKTPQVGLTSAKSRPRATTMWPAPTKHALVGS